MEYQVRNRVHRATDKTNFNQICQCMNVPVIFSALLARHVASGEIEVILRKPPPPRIRILESHLFFLLVKFFWMSFPPHHFQKRGNVPVYTMLLFYYRDLTVYFSLEFLYLQLMKWLNCSCYGVKIPTSDFLACSSLLSQSTWLNLGTGLGWGLSCDRQKSQPDVKGCQ